MSLESETLAALGEKATHVPIEQASCSNEEIKSRGSDIDIAQPTDHLGVDSGPVRKKKCVQFESPVVSGQSSTQDVSGESVCGGSGDVESVRGVVDVKECMGQVSENLKHMLLEWTEGFLESESFEVFCPKRMDELLKEMLVLEQHLQTQKEDLKNRLGGISKTLQI